jgi:M6 family metalloprotease-like protein
MRKYILLTLIALVAGLLPLQAVPARPGLYIRTQPDGTKIVLRQHGDEFAHWLTDAFGRIVREDADGFYRPVSGTEAEQLRRGAPARRAAARTRRAAKARQHIAVGQKHFLVILVEFSNKEFSTSTDPKAAFTALMNEEGYSVTGGTGSARDFYRDNSHGAFDPVFDVFGPVKLENPFYYYGGNDYSGNDKAAEDAVIEGCIALDEEIDFTRYDNDGDGEVDMVFMYYAGKGEADGGTSNTIWPHQYEISSCGKSLTLDGVKIDSYACTNEVVGGGELEGKMCGIGTACHEFAHAMGLPDFYDVDYGSNGQSHCLFFFSTMDTGAYNNEGRTPPYFNFEERVLLGWLDESEYREFSTTDIYTLPSVDENVAYRTPTDMEGEYFVYECRGSNGWDAGLLSHGLVVYHVDKSSRTVKGSLTARGLWDDCMSTNMVNAYGSHPCFYVIPSADQDNLLFGHYLYSGDYFFDEEYAPQIPFPGSDGVTTYEPVSWNGVKGLISFGGIAYADNLVTLRAYVPTDELDYVTIADAGSYRSGDRFPFELVQPEKAEVPATVVWYYDDEPVGADSVTLTAGSHTVEARLIYADGRQEVLTLEIGVQ